MNDNLATALVAAFLAGLTTAVGWVIARVLGAREDSLVLQGKVVSLEAKVASLESELKTHQSSAITQECVRAVIEEALSRRDASAAERRQAWDERLALKVEAAVVAGVQTCQAQTRVELERMVPRIVREVLAQRDA